LQEIEEMQSQPATKRAKLSGAALLLGLEPMTTEEEGKPPPITSEVDRYMALPQIKAILPSGNEACLLEWWKAQEPTLPHLAKMARQFLALPASSAGPERLFHAARRMHDELKKATKDTTLEHILNVYANS
jgi:hypothetical protein